MKNKAPKPRRHVKFNTGTRVHKDKRREWVTYKVDLGTVEIPEDYDELELTIKENGGEWVSSDDYGWK